MLVEVERLQVDFVSRGLDNRVRTANALNDVTFNCDSGQILALVGETGAGKSLTAFAIMRLLKPPAQIVGGSIRFEGRDSPRHRKMRCASCGARRCRWFSRTPRPPSIRWRVSARS